MIKQALLISLLLYLISCTSSDNNVLSPNRMETPKPLKVSIGTVKTEATKVKEFDEFLNELPFHQMIHASETDLQESVKYYLPDSTISEGYDLHIREIGRIDTFRLVFHEYFDLYDDWSKTYLNIFSPAGQCIQSMRLWDLSFEGNISINFVNNEIIEITYHDFFEPQDLKNHALIPDHNFYMENYTRVNDKTEGTIYEYYKISEEGALNVLSQNIQISEDRVFPHSSAKLFSQSELERYEVNEIRLMKDEILADHGFIFSDRTTQGYFETLPWYLPTTKNVDSLLTDIEKLNFALLSKVEKEY